MGSQPANVDGTQGSWHYRRVDLSSFAGKTIDHWTFLTDTSTSPGAWDIYYEDFSFVSADGTVLPMYTRQKAVSLSVNAYPGMTGVGYEVNHWTGAWFAPGESTTYYHSDHLGSARTLTNDNGYPLWSATFLPFGQEWNPQPTVNHYKFTGDERDSESQLDQTPFRQYASTLGRWSQPDPAGLAAVDPSNPQSWNRYAYVLNNPLAFDDPTGLYCDGADGVGLGTGGNPGNGTGIFTQEDCVANGGTWIDPVQTTITVTADPLPDPGSVPGGPDLRGILSDSSGSGNISGGFFSGFLNRTKTVNRCAGQLSQAGSVTNLAKNLLGLHVPEVLGSNTFGDIASLATGSGGLDQGAALAADATAHAAPAIATQVAVGTVTSIGKAISNTPGVYNPVTVGITTRTVGMTTAGKFLIGAAEAALKGKVLLDAGVYLGALVVCSEE